jgi:hypothetical protein
MLGSNASMEGHGRKKPRRGRRPPLLLSCSQRAFAAGWSLPSQ